MAIQDQDIIARGMLENGVAGGAGPHGLSEGNVADRTFIRRHGAAIVLQCLG